MEQKKAIIVEKSEAREFNDMLYQDVRFSWLRDDNSVDWHGTIATTNDRALIESENLKEGKTGFLNYSMTGEFTIGKNGGKFARNRTKLESFIVQDFKKKDDPFGKVVDGHEDGNHEAMPQGTEQKEQPMTAVDGPGTKLKDVAVDVKNDDLPF